MDQLRVILASPGDVQPERDAIPAVIEELNRHLAAVLDVELKLHRWETDAFPGFHPEGPQGLIDPLLRIDNCDVLIGIFWKRFGTPTKDANSGTEHEFRTAFEAWRQNQRPHIMVYFKEAPYLPQSDQEIDQWGRVLKFKKAFPKEGLWWTFTETGEFRELIRNHLSNWLRHRDEVRQSRPSVDIDEQPGSSFQTSEERVPKAQHDTSVPEEAFSGNATFVSTKEMADLLGQLHRTQLRRLMIVVEMPTERRPGDDAPAGRVINEMLEWAEGKPNRLRTLYSEAHALIEQSP